MKIKILSRIIQLLALYLFFTSLYVSLGKIITIQTGTKIFGKVISSYKETDYSTQTGNKRYGLTHYILRPIIKYQVNGEIYEFHGKILGEVGNHYQIGQPVPLYLSADKPDYAIINSFYELWYEPLRNLFFSIGLFLIGTFLAKILSKIKDTIVN
ncbi:DUF3592 domain-containing protein [Leptospira levettii]|uniref:DUF3592 domain-containing protein n=1 Tax=Leptospira levettii TaxID=2023178 RepID=UPI00108422BA|nr:DUF3592 domain-containing protein [Leptospira levettii]MCW7506731.1 DUF3592 domain-containing protein [Leptospira levettii]MCW7517821.1 DUF3592 domain-containing protein [Leptospira levettii]TGM31410.1 DUF3592 domain-containing protein [Leptospira levettii]TGM91781.1 DUF3592 domain-containing protein [Leptospira levettii]